MRLKLSFLLSLNLLGGLLLTSPVFANDYPPAMAYEQMPDFINLSPDGSLLFANKLLSMHVYVPGRDVQTRIDIVDAKGNIISTKERVHAYKNGQALGEINTWANACEGGTCLDGPSKPQLTPGIYWIVFSEKGKIFSAEWFEVRSFKLGEGRFAKGEVNYAILPHDQMASLYFSDGGKGSLMADIGFSVGPEVKDGSAVTKPVAVSLKHNGKPFAKSPGNVPQPTNIYAHTTMLTVSLSLIPKGEIIKPAQLKDGSYEMDVTIAGKLVRRFKFQVKGGKIVYQGRQSENTKPPERMVASEKHYWLWNTLAKEPSYALPAVQLTTSAPASSAEVPASSPMPVATPVPTPTPKPADPMQDALKQLPKLPF
jgi:hypothetical protein